MASQSCVINLDVYFEIFIQTVSFQEADNSFSIYVILMFCRFHRFRLNQESTFEATSTCIVTSDSQHLRKVFFFTFLVSVQQRHVTFATAVFSSFIHRIPYVNGLKYVQAGGESGFLGR